MRCLPAFASIMLSAFFLSNLATPSRAEARPNAGDELLFEAFSTKAKGTALCHGLDDPVEFVIKFEDGNFVVEVNELENQVVTSRKLTLAIKGEKARFDGQAISLQLSLEPDPSDAAEAGRRYPADAAEAGRGYPFGGALVGRLLAATSDNNQNTITSFHSSCGIF